MIVLLYKTHINFSLNLTFFISFILFQSKVVLTRLELVFLTWEVNVLNISIFVSLRSSWGHRYYQLDDKTELAVIKLLKETYCYVFYRYEEILSLCSPQWSLTTLSRLRIWRTNDIREDQNDKNKDRILEYL